VKFVSVSAAAGDSGDLREFRAENLAKPFIRMHPFLSQNMTNRISFIFLAIKTSSRYYTTSRTYIQHIHDGEIPNMASSRSAEHFIDLADELEISDRSGKRGGRGVRRKGGGRDGGGSRGNRAEGSGGGEMNREGAISKALSKLLRHAALDAGLKLDSEGFAKVDQVVSTCVLLDSSTEGVALEINSDVT
jgi:hypothetical protein